MNKRTQKEKALLLLALHQGEEMLVLPNIWDPIGARILAAQGYPAIATASAAIVRGQPTLGTGSNFAVNS